MTFPAKESSKSLPVGKLRNRRGWTAAAVLFLPSAISATVFVDY
ncbi:MAG: hypothetical protein ACR2GD_00920 [Pyrinomonadaceae bacterium]